MKKIDNNSPSDTDEHDSAIDDDLLRFYNIRRGIYEKYRNKMIGTLVLVMALCVLIGLIYLISNGFNKVNTLAISGIAITLAAVAAIILNHLYQTIAAKKTLAHLGAAACLGLEAIDRQVGVLSGLISKRLGKEMPIDQLMKYGKDWIDGTMTALNLLWSPDLMPGDPENERIEDFLRLLDDMCTTAEQAPLFFKIPPLPSAWVEWQKALE
jgi:hypothetical protein